MWCEEPNYLIIVNMINLLPVNAPRPLGRGAFAEFFPSEQVQLNLFESGHRFRKSGELMQTIDQINREKSAIWFAGQGMQSQSALWKMKQQFLSPRWTIQLSDIPRVRC